MAPPCCSHPHSRFPRTPARRSALLAAGQDCLALLDRDAGILSLEVRRACVCVCARARARAGIL